MHQWAYLQSHRSVASRLSKARGLVTFLLGMFLVATLVVPAAPINKFLFIVLLLVLVIAAVRTGGKVPIRSLAPLVVTTTLLFGYLLSFVHETDQQLTTQFMLSVSVLFLLYLIDWFDVDFERLIMMAGVAFCIITGLTVYVVMAIPDTTAGKLVLGAVLKYGQGAYGSRSFTDSALYMFRLGAAPFLFLPYCLFFRSLVSKWRFKDLIALMMIVAVIVVTTSRALVLACILASVFMVAIQIKSRLQVVVACLLAAVGLAGVLAMISLTSVFSLDDPGNSIKVGHAASFVENLTLARMLFGEGLASFYFSAGFNSLTAQTEITPLDFARYVGFPLTAILYMTLLFPTWDRGAYAGSNGTRLVLFLLYLAISMTNPVMFNSYGLLVVVWYWNAILSRRPTQPHLVAPGSRSS
jgi:hypothetical protein